MIIMSVCSRSSNDVIRSLITMVGGDDGECDSDDDDDFYRINVNFTTVTTAV